MPHDNSNRKNDAITRHGWWIHSAESDIFFGFRVILFYCLLEALEWMKWAVENLGRYFTISKISFGFYKKATLLPIWAFNWLFFEFIPWRRNSTKLEMCYVLFSASHILFAYRMHYIAISTILHVNLPRTLVLTRADWRKDSRLLYMCQINRHRWLFWPQMECVGVPLWEILIKTWKFKTRN